MKQRIRLIVVVALLTLSLDQGSKWWAKNTLADHAPITLVSNYLELSYHENRGVAFGMFKDLPAARYVFTGIGIAALYFVWRMIRATHKHQKISDIAFSLIIGGAIGNLVDRIYLGKVVDFIVMHWQKKLVWPAYNVADAALVIGILVLVIVMGNNPVSSTTTRRK